MPLRPVLRFALLSLCVLLLLYSSVLSGRYLFGASPPTLSLSVAPAAVVIKVGANSTVNLRVTSGASSGLICFSEQGFPESGFVLSYVPQCAAMQQHVVSAQLTVEATPAAAPQNFTALILASLQNQTASAPLSVTVVPAIPAWIPWLGIVLFFLVICAALFIKPKRSPKPKRKGKMGV